MSSKSFAFLQTLGLKEIRSGELLYEALQNQKKKEKQKQKSEMKKQRLTLKEQKSGLSTGDMKGVLIYPLLFDLIHENLKK